MPASSECHHHHHHHHLVDVKDDLWQLCLCDSLLAMLYNRCSSVAADQHVLEVALCMMQPSLPTLSKLRQKRCLSRHAVGLSVPSIFSRAMDFGD